MTDDAEIRAFISRTLNVGDVGDDTDIFATGLVNDQFPFQVSAFLERNFGINIEPDDMNIENFRTIKAMAALVACKR